MLLDASRRRVFPYRLSGDARPSEPGPGRTGRDVVLIARAVVARASSLPREQVGAEDLRIVSMAHVALGELDEAVVALQTITKLHPHEASAWSDLAAVWATRGAPADMLRAFDSALRGGRAPSHAVEARLNAALLAERLLPASDALVEWQAVLEARPPVPIVQEARSRLDALRVRAEHERAGTPHVLSAQYEASLLRAKLATCQGIATATGEIGQAILDSAEDQYLRALAGWLGATGCRASVLAALRRYLSSLDAYGQDRCESASRDFSLVIRELRFTSSPLVVASRAYRAACWYFGDVRDRAEGELDGLVEVLDGRQYWHLLGRVEWMRGYIAEDQSRFDAAHLAYQRAAAAYARAGNRDGEVVAVSLLANLTDTLGDYAGGWRHRERVLPPRTGMNNRWLVSSLASLMRATQRDGLRYASAVLARVRTRAAAAEGSPVRLAEALGAQARISVMLGDLSLARTLLKKAATEAERIAANGTRLRVEADLALVAARLPQVHGTAHLLLSRAIRAYEAAGSDLPRARVLLERARELRSAGRSQEAERDLRQATSILERVRGSISAAPTRLSYFEEAWDAYEELLTLQVRQKRFGEALDLVARARGLELHARIGGGVPSTELAGLMPRRSALIAYAVLPDHLVTWVFENGRFHHHLSEVSREHVAALVDQSRRNDATGERALALLHGLLIAPVSSTLTGARRLYISPDPILHVVPFAALRQERDSAFLVQSYEILLTPGLSMLKRGALRPSPTRATVISAPSPPSDLGLPTIPGTTREAGRIASMYRHGELVSGDRIAARGARGWPTRGLVHFAGHAIVHPELPFLSRLLLGESREHGSLYARDVLGLDLSGVQTVVLAACESAAGRTYRSEGVPSLASAFVASGAESVIATLRQVDDGDASRFFVRLHEKLSTGTAAATALAQVQREWIRDGGADSMWRTAVVVTRVVSEEIVE